MKTIRLLPIFLMLAMTLSACNNTKKSSEMTNEKKKTLVAYFSATGTTEQVAKTLAEAAQADLFKIEPEKPYTAADLNWNNDKSRSSVEMKDKSSRPAIANRVENIDQYDVIYIGFPVWWYTAPTIINTFLEQYNLEGKTLIPFATSGGSKITNVHNELAVSAPNATWKQGSVLNGNPSVDELRSWINELQK